MVQEQYPKVYLYRRIVQAKLFIDKHYADNIDLNNISDEAYFSKFHFTRLFKKIYGRTPHQYLIFVRIEKARHFLRAGTPVSEVCTAVGFESLSSFSGLFKRLTGTNPSSYLAKQRQLNIQMKTSPLRFVPSCYAYQHGWKEE